MTEALRVGVAPGVTADKWVRVWRERMRDVQLQIVALADTDTAAALGETVDMLFARLPLRDLDDLQVIPLWTETPVVVAAKDHAISVVDSVTLADLEDEELHPGWDDATLDIVAAGHGIARMPQSVFRGTGRRDLIAREITDAEPTRIGLVWRSGGPLVEEFIGIVRGRTANSSRGSAPSAPRPATREAARSGRRKKGDDRGRRR